MKAGFIVLLLLTVPTTQFGIIAGLIIGTANIFISGIQTFTQCLNAFTQKYNKSYASVEEMAYRSIVFQNNLNVIDQHNNNRNRKYNMGVTRFADMPMGEILNLLLMPKFRFEEAMNRANSWYTPAIPNNLFFSNSFLMPPRLQQSNSVNWKNKGVVSVMKEQGVCGSCYAFAALGAIESMYRIYNMTSIGFSGRTLGNTLQNSLSQQHIVDCCNIKGKCDMGCQGGYVWSVYDFIKTNGVNLYATHPYTITDQNYKRNCRGASGQFKNILNPTNPYTNITKKDPADLKQKLMKGPVAVLIDATNMPFYVHDGKSKIIPFTNCTQNKNNHAVLVVGIDDSGNWLVKNSWGSDWGQQGYITLAPGNTCGIANYAVLPNPYLP